MSQVIPGLTLTPALSRLFGRAKGAKREGWGEGTTHFSQYRSHFLTSIKKPCSSGAGIAPDEHLKQTAGYFLM
jgi:hypothetical protein